MIETRFKLDNRGQVGIGTLIVFIAMVLVAAIAAGVLVNTADMLQESAEQTGEDSQAQVSDRIQVIDVYGSSDILYDRDSGLEGNTDSADIGKTVATTDDTSGTSVTSGEPVVHQLGFLVMRAAGANDINLETVTVSWQGPDGAEQTTVLESPHISTEAVAGDSDTLLDSSSDRIMVTLNLGEVYVDEDGGSSTYIMKQSTTDTDSDTIADSTDDYQTTNFGHLEEGDEVTIKFNTEAGATITKKVKIPSLIQDGETIDL